MTDSSMDDEQTEQILDAAEYVLGTLEPEQAAQIDEALPHEPQMRSEIVYWESRLGVLGLGVEPIEPPAAVWQSIADRIGIDTPQLSGDHERVTPIRSSAKERKGAAARGSGRAWQGLAVAASVAAIAMAAVLFSGVTANQPSSSEPAFASVLYDKPTGMSWLVTAPDKAHTLSVKAMSSYQVPDGKVLRLWMEPDDGKPMFLGKWPHRRGEHTMDMPDAVASQMPHAKRLMVTMENADTAPGAGPFKQVMWVSPVARHTS